MFCFKILLFAFISLGYGLNEHYFWREYTGTIPTDAVVAGSSNKTGHNIYIGQVYIENVGIVVTQIDQGSKEVLVPFFGVLKRDKYIKILCGPQENFSWIAASAMSLHSVLINKHAVIGGHQDGRGILNIGRVSFEGEIKIGKVLAGQARSSPIYFSANEDEELGKHYYNVLVYSKNKSEV